MTEKLEGAARETEALADLQSRGWEMAEGRDAIVKTFKFKNFIEAFGWMSRMAIHGRKAEPPSRVVQRLQPGRGDLDDP